MSTLLFDVRSVMYNFFTMNLQVIESVDICESRMRARREREKDRRERGFLQEARPLAPPSLFPPLQVEGLGGQLGQLTVLGPFVVGGRVGGVGEDTTRGDDNRSALLLLGHDHPLLRAFDVLDCLHNGVQVLS